MGLWVREWEEERLDEMHKNETDKKKLKARAVLAVET